jgi:hypothetical protein
MRPSHHHHVLEDATETIEEAVVESFDYETEEDEEPIVRPQTSRPSVQNNSGGGVKLMEVDVDYTLIGPSEDPSVNRVVIECDILSYAVNREGPGFVSAMCNMIGCSEDDTIHLDEILHGVKATFYPG